MFILWVLLNKRCVYYFWGFGDSGYLKTLIKKFIIGKCSIIVNHQDHLTYWKKSKNYKRTDCFNSSFNQTPHDHEKAI